MHPLETTLDESVHTARAHAAKRRSSLDNSCLAAAETFRHLVPDCVDFTMSPRRRLSLNAMEQAKTTTFLATNPDSRPKLDLDADFHNSIHSSQAFLRYANKSSHSAGTFSTASGFGVAGGDRDDGSIGGSSLESDADTFCDASVQEPANREYLRKDLGASCFWNSGDMGLSDFELSGMNDKLDQGLAQIVIAEGVELE